MKCCGGTSYTDYMESVWRQNDLHFENRRNKAPLTCCNDYWKYKDAPGSEFGYCSIYLIDPDTSGNQLPTELNYKLFRKVRIWQRGDDSDNFHWCNFYQVSTYWTMGKHGETCRVNEAIITSSHNFMILRRNSKNCYYMYNLSVATPFCLWMMQLFLGTTQLLLIEVSLIMWLCLTLRIRSEGADICYFCRAHGALGIHISLSMYSTLNILDRLIQVFAAVCTCRRSHFLIEEAGIKLNSVTQCDQLPKGIQAQHCL